MIQSQRERAKNSIGYGGSGGPAVVLTIFNSII